GCPTSASARAWCSGGRRTARSACETNGAGPGPSPWSRSRSAWSGHAAVSSGYRSPSWAAACSSVCSEEPAVHQPTIRAYEEVGGSYAVRRGVQDPERATTFALAVQRGTTPDDEVEPAHDRST